MIPVPITTTEDLECSMRPLHDSSVITIDTEFMREITFWPTLCLIQIASQDHQVLIDALSSDLNLSPFFELMDNKNVLKVFHAARQDIEAIFHLSHSIPAPIFDTQIAAMVCGYGDSIGYDSLVRKITRHEIDKGCRFTDWSRRPLNDKQLAYALADVTHLSDVYHALDKQLRENQRSSWMQEEMNILTSPSTYENLPEDAWRRLKLRVRKPEQLAILMEVAAWREVEAQRRNLSRNRVLKDEAIYEIATQMPRTHEHLGQLRSLGARFIHSPQAMEILDVVKDAPSCSSLPLPMLGKRPPLSGNIGPITDLLKVLLKRVSEKEGVSSRIIAVADDIEQIAMNDDADVPAMRGWRRELFGNMALRLKHGDISLSIDNGCVVVSPIEKKQADAPGYGDFPTGN